MSQPLNRRAFLATGAIATAGFALVGARPAGAATGVTVYRLSSDWGYPVGPKHKTRCVCRSCRRRAKNAYFRTREAAIDGRVHPCCVCQPYRSTVTAQEASQLFAGTDSADRRDPRVEAMFDGVTFPTPDPIGSVLGLGSTGTNPTGGSGQPTVGTSGPAASGGAMGFARTGTNLRLAGIGAGLLAIGGALVALRTRRPSEPATTSHSQPPTKESP
jgi:hypothetical protein